jgi:hypothetical protein
LPQGDAESRLQRVVEHGIARAVEEIGEDDGVLLGKWLALMGTIIEASGEQKNR